MQRSFDIFIRAFTHRSYSREYGGANNEHLEFLGDSVLQLLITELLIERFPSLTEGQLSQMRHRLVNNELLGACARSLQFGSMLRLGAGERRSNGADKNKILANTFEACLGALYLHDGLDSVRRVIYHHFIPHLRQAQRKTEKQILHEWSQKRYHMPPRYLEIKREGDAHNLIFTVAVWINDQNIASGEGASFKKATIQAAKTAVLILDIS